VSRLVITETAAEDLKRCLEFLASKSIPAMIKATATINKAFHLLKDMPQMGRPFRADPKLRELPIKFGNSGYLALYHYDTDNKIISIIAFKHHREQGYKSRIEY